MGKVYVVSGGGKPGLTLKEAIDEARKSGKLIVPQSRLSLNIEATVEGVSNGKQV